jgi:hypothetical protein
VPGPRDPGGRGPVLRMHDGVPVFASGQGPEGLFTVSGLARIRRKVAPGQQPLAYIVTRWWGDQVALYDPAGAVKMRPLGSAQKRKMAARRTCPQCGQVAEHIVRGPMCVGCLLGAQAAVARLRARTCDRCRRVRTRPYRSGQRLCRTCTARRRREQSAAAVQEHRRRVTCPSPRCDTRTATSRQYEVWRAGHPYGYWQPPPVLALPAGTGPADRGRREAPGSRTAGQTPPSPNPGPAPGADPAS